jgi:DNA repair protein RecO (recombination protein O)
LEYKIFYMTTEILRCLSQFNENFEKLTAAYELKLVSILGYKPDFYHCISCGAKIKSSAKFSIVEGGFYCFECEKNGSGINMDYNEIIVLQRILKSKFEDISSIEIITIKVLSLIRNYLFYHIGKDNFVTLKLL